MIQPADTVVNTDVVDGLVDPNTINESVSVFQDWFLRTTLFIRKIVSLQELPTVEDIAPVNFEVGALTINIFYEP